MKHDIDSVYINFWGKQKPKFTELELAIMEGGHSLGSEHEKTNSNTGDKPIRMQFIAGLHSKPLGR